MGDVMNDRMARYVALIENPASLDMLVQRVAEEGSLPSICKSLDVPHGRVLTWLMADIQRYQLYLRALEVFAHQKVSETIPLADDVPANKDAVAKANLQVNTRFRVAKHHAPALYAEKVEVKHSGVVTFSHALQGVAARRLAAKKEPLTVEGEVIKDETVL